MNKILERLGEPRTATILVIISLSLIVLSQTVFAQRYPDERHFGISISNTCYRMHEYNITTTCPTYEGIMAVFPDTSDRNISGKFIFKDGQLQRAKTQMKNHLEWYQFENKSVLFINPDPAIQSRIKMIHIEAQLPEYPVLMKVENNNRITGELRYIEGCRVATIDASAWLWLLGDTIHFMKNDCDPDFAEFNETRITQKVLVEHDITTSNKWLHERFIEWVKQNCSQEYASCPTK